MQQDLSFSAGVRDCLADVVEAFGGRDQAASIRSGADIILVEPVASLDGIEFGELAEAWSIETLNRHGVYLGFNNDGTIYTYKRRSELH